MKQPIGRWLWCVVGVMSLMVGCAQETHKDHKAAAMARWQSARAEIAANMARQQFEAGDLAKAAKAAENMVAQAPDYIPGRLLLGQIYLEQDRPAQARKCFEKCLEIAPDDAAAHYNLGIVHERWGQLDQAYSHYEQAASARPDYVPYTLALVEVCASRGDYEQALAMLDESMLEYGQDASVFVAAGGLLTRLGRDAEAVTMLQRAHGLNGEDDQIVELLAFGLYRVGRYDEALKLFGRLITKGQADRLSLRSSLWLAAGDCSMYGGDYHQAQRYFEEVVRQTGDDPTGWLRLAQVATLRGEVDYARQSAQRVLSLDRDHVDALLILGYLELKQQQYGLAERHLRRIVELDASNGVAYCLLGQTLEASGNPSAAAKCYDRALMIQPGDTLAQRLYASVNDQQTGAATRSGITER